MKFIELSGEIIGTETWSQTHVSGRSSGVSYRGIGASSGRTTSIVVNVGQVWVRTSDGQEVAVRVNPDKFATRDGHSVSMFVTVPKNGPHAMIAGINHSTGATRRESLAGPYFQVPFVLLFLGWLPILFWFMHPLIGLVTGGLLLWACWYALSTAHKVGSMGSRFLQDRRAGSPAQFSPGQAAPAQSAA